MPECRSCGADNDDSSMYCAYCGTRLPAPPPRQPDPQTYRTAYDTEHQPGRPAGAYTGPHVKNWLVESILITVLCCVPLGIGGIVNAMKVDRLAAEGDLAGAREASARAKLFVVIGVVLGIVFSVFYVLAKATELIDR